VRCGAPRSGGGALRVLGRGDGLGSESLRPGRERVEGEVGDEVHRQVALLTAALHTQHSSKPAPPPAEANRRAQGSSQPADFQASWPYQRGPLGK